MPTQNAWEASVTQSFGWLAYDHQLSPKEQANYNLRKDFFRWWSVNAQGQKQTNKTHAHLRPPNVEQLLHYLLCYNSIDPETPP